MIRSLRSTMTTASFESRMMLARRRVALSASRRFCMSMRPSTTPSVLPFSVLYGRRKR
jgi:hypothetical protein